MIGYNHIMRFLLHFALAVCVWHAPANAETKTEAEGAPRTLNRLKSDGQKKQTALVRKPASIDGSAINSDFTIDRNPQLLRRFLSANMETSLSTLMLGLEYQHSLNGTFALGLRSNFSQSLDVRAVGVHVGVDTLLSRTFMGWHWYNSIGKYFLTDSTPNLPELSAQPLAFSSMIGARFRVKGASTVFSASGGIQYIDAAAREVTPSFVGIVPMLSVGVGLGF